MKDVRHFIFEVAQPAQGRVAQLAHRIRRARA
jgi:hypothetical protein